MHGLFIVLDRIVIINNVKDKDSKSLEEPFMLNQRQPIKLGSFKRGNVEQQLQQLTRRHQFWLAQQKKCNIDLPNIQFIHIFKGLVVNLQRISDLLLYQCFCFSKIEACSHKVIEQAKRYMFYDPLDCNAASQIEMLKIFLRKKKLPQKDQKECDQYRLHLSTKNQADKAYTLQKHCGKIYSVLMLYSGDRALNNIQVSISHQEKANLIVQALENDLPQVKQSEQQRQKVVKLICQLTLYAIPFLAMCYEREWTHMRRSILSYHQLIKELQALHQNETSRPS